MHTRLIPSLLVLCAGLAAEDLITVTIAHDPLPGPAPGTSTTDAGAMLRDLPGVDAVRMGGLGLDPVVRGQSASRVRVIVDGACPLGGCPNRMDPPTTYAPAGADQASVVPGGLDVRQPGAPLGVVRLERESLRFDGTDPVQAKAEARYAGNGNASEAGAELALGQEWGYVRGAIHAARADDYSDGNGDSVRSAYRSLKGGGNVGWTPGERTRIELGQDYTRERDVLYAGAGMDATYADDRTTRLRLQHEGDGVLASLALDAWASRVEHSMDNYSLRPATGMRMRAPSTSATTGARAQGSLRTAVGLLGLGLDGEEVHQDARRYSGPTDTTVTTLNSLLWPDARIGRLGAWSDLTISPAERWRVIPGLRVDVVRSEAADASVDPPGGPLSPDALYTLYYGATAQERSETLFGATLRCERDWGTDGTLAVAASRQQRAADPTERFIAGNGTTANARWVGNPDLVAETHNQVQVVASQGGDDEPGWHGEAWIDRVQDYIRRDRARGQDGVLLADQATIYHNGQALLAGLAGSGSLPVNGWLGAQADAAWTWGEDLDSHQPLAQIPPLSGSAGLRAHRDSLASQLTLRWAARATRVDDNAATGSALDAGETPAWAVLDWSMSWQPERHTELALGIDNLFDRAYAEHLNKPSAFDTTVVRVNEPGRNMWASLSVRF